MWLDSICINQADQAEKSVQVQMMGSIYAKAVRVLACVGPHDDQSRLLIQIVRNVECRRGQSKPRDFSWSEYKKVWPQPKGLPGPKDREEDPPADLASRNCPLQKAWEAFSDRPYWSRLWIVQEIARAAVVQVLCGDDVLSWQLIQVLSEMDDREIDPKILVRHAVEPEDMFWKYGRYHCSDPRDHVYALLGMINWRTDSETLAPPTPDYSISAFGLAVRMVQYLPFRTLSRMLETLNVDMFDQEVQDSVKERRLLSLTQSKQRVAPTVSNSSVTMKDRLCTRLRVDSNGDLTASFTGRVRTGSNDPPPPFPKLSSELSGMGQYYTRLLDDSLPWSARPCGQVPLQLMISGEIAALTCEDSRPDDILIEMTGKPPTVFLVVRENSRQLYDIVGQATFLEGYQRQGECRCKETLSEGHDFFEADVELDISAEDLIVLLAQDQVKCDGDGLHWMHTHHPRARIERLITRVTSSPLGAASLSNIRCGNDYRNWCSICVGISYGFSHRLHLDKSRRGTENDKHEQPHARRDKDYGKVSQYLRKVTNTGIAVMKS